jgi:hypothetical protein
MRDYHLEVDNKIWIYGVGFIIIIFIYIYLKKKKDNACTEVTHVIVWEKNDK